MFNQITLCPFSLKFFQFLHPKINVMFTIPTIMRPVHRCTKRTLMFSVTFNRSYKSVPKAPLPLVRSKLVPYVPEQFKSQIYYFRTSQRRDVPPIVALLLRPVLRISALIFGRVFRRWWNRKSVLERDEFVGWFSSKKATFFGISGTLLLGLLVYYIMHIETDPLTNRSRLILFNKKQQDVLAKLTFEMHLEEHKGHLVPRNDPVYDKLLKLTNRLLNANRDLPRVRDKHWTLTVVDLPLKNAYVLPGGNIFIFMGALKLVENEDQLSIVVAHEMAHALLQHSIEQVSNGMIVDILIAVPIVLIWAIFPDIIAGFVQFLGQQIVDIVHNLPYSRALEIEADEVGLTLAAKACVDVREAVVFWAMMRTLTELDAEPDQIPWLSTHPNHGDREKKLNAQTPEAMAIRARYGCSELDPVDPRKKFYEHSKKENEARFKQRGVI